MSVGSNRHLDFNKEYEMEGRTVSHSAVIMTHAMMPHQANPFGAVHGGEIMKMMDEAAGVAAARHCHGNVVTARVDGINFFRPVIVGNLVIINAYLVFVSRSTMDVRVEVVSEDIFKEETQHALTAHFIMVAVDGNGKPIEVPPLIISSDAEKKLWKLGEARYKSCKKELMTGDDEFKVCREDAFF